MGYLADSYRQLSPLKTDQYQLTMAQGYFNDSTHEDKASFYMHWRKPPFGGAYTVAAGLEGVADFLKHFKFSDEDVAYLRTIKVDNKRLYTDEFLDYLRNMKLDLDVDAVPEGTVVTGAGPVVRITGPLIQCQLVESAVLNIVNSASMIATRAARINEASDGKAKFADFSLRRSPTLDTGVARAAFIGGAGATSDVDAGKRLGIPTVGTMAHSWIMKFQRPDISNKQAEREAFDSYIKSYPTNTVMLVDTFDTVTGIQNAIDACIAQNTPLKGVRIDSGDLLALTHKAKDMLDTAARQHPDLFSKSLIYLTNDLDEEKIHEFYVRSASDYGKPFPDNVVYGVGTSLGNPGPLGGVYKISAYAPHAGTQVATLDTTDAQMIRTMKVAGVDPNDPTLPGTKSSLPGAALDTIRLKDGNGMVLADVITDTSFASDADDAIKHLLQEGKAIDLADNRTLRDIPQHATAERLLKPVFRAGEYVYPEHGGPKEVTAYEGGPNVTDLREIQARTKAQVAGLPINARFLHSPVHTPVLLDPRINDERRSILSKMQAANDTSHTQNIDMFIDVQNGFARYDLSPEQGGCLYVPGGEKVGAKIGEMIKNTQDGIIVLSQDYHPANHISFMTSHPGIMAFRKQRLIAAGKSPDDVLSPLAMAFDELVFDKKGMIIGIKDGEHDRVRKVRLSNHDGSITEGFVPGNADKGRVSEVLDEYLDTPFSQMKGVSTQMCWSPHCVQNTPSCDFVPELGLPQGLTDLLHEDTTSPNLKYTDEKTGNTFYVVRKGMNSEIDSYGIGIENDKKTRTTAPEVFDAIASDLADQDCTKAVVNIGGLATNFCVEFSHNNVRDLMPGSLRMRGIEQETNYMPDISAGIPIPGGTTDPFSLEGAATRMVQYDKGNPTRIRTSDEVLRTRKPETHLSGAAHASGLPTHARTAA